ncbi:MAG: HAD family phosphatase [Clostridia bacterium]|nr:HAD family phosphatase [Clostridia bacterium]
MKINGVIFDMDGTLVDSLSFWEHLWFEIGTRYLSNPSFLPEKDDDKRVRTMIYKDAMRFIMEKYRIVEDEERFEIFSVNLITDFYKSIAKAKPGAVELLEYLKKQGIKICLASATARREIGTSLEATGLLKYFDHILSCADLGVGKEKPDVYLEALAQMGLPADNVWVVEDSYVALESAKSAGLKTVGVYDKYSYNQDRLRASADVYLGEGHTLAELTKIFE